jgi:hypothetical protein
LRFNSKYFGTNFQQGSNTIANVRANIKTQISCVYTASIKRFSFLKFLLLNAQFFAVTGSREIPAAKINPPPGPIVPDPSFDSCLHPSKNKAFR